MRMQEPDKTSIPLKAASTRRLDLDRAKGLGIFLVVLGHIVSKGTPPGNMWYSYLQYAVYEFHMPFFMYLSGYVVFLSGADRTTPSRWPNLVGKRFQRLLLPFLIFGVLVIIGKFLASRYMYVDNLPTSVWRAFVDLTWDTDNSPSLSVWYILVLFVFCIATPPILWAARGSAAALVVFAAVIYVLPVPHVLYLDRVAGYFLFFSLGGLAANSGAAWLKLIEERVLWFVAIFLIADVLLCLPQTHEIPPRSIKLLVSGVLSMPALHGLILRTPLCRNVLLLWLGTYSFVIYLLNIPCLGISKGILLHFMPWDGLNFLVFFPILLVTGLVGPIFIKKHVLRLWPAADHITS
jgi:fucose 4-O-acetylase-like acetyltransferase